MLTKSSVLHHWSARFGINPRVGGRPVYTRNSAGIFVSQEGEADSAVINTPRYDWSTLSLPSAQTERRKLLTLEMASSNLVIQSDAIATGWTVATLTPTNAYVTRANISFSRLTGLTNVATARRSVTFTGNGLKGFSIVVRSDGVAGTGFVSVKDTVAAAFRFVGGYVIAADGTITLSAPVVGTNIGIVPLGEGVYRLLFQTTAVTAANTHDVYAFDGQGASTLTSVQVSGVQAEDAQVPTALMSTTTTAVTRAVDSCYWNYTPIPQALMAYLRFVEQGSIFGSATATCLFYVGAAGNVNPRFLLYPSGGFYLLQYSGAAGGLVQSVQASAPVVGDTVEMLAILYADGSVELIQSKNGAAAVSAGRTAANPNGMAAAWSDTRLYLNSLGSGATGASKYADMRIVKFADVVGATADDRMAELRAFELGPNGDVL